jgi:hypothetical protein
MVKATAGGSEFFFRGIVIACRKMNCSRKNTVITIESAAYAHACKCGNWRVYRVTKWGDHWLWNGASIENSMA